MSEMDIDTDSIRDGADELEQAADEVSEIFEQFQASIESYAEAFGGDEIGMLLSVAHGACAEAAAGCFSTNIDELHNYSEGLRAMADGYEEAEQDIRGRFDKFEVS